MGMVINVIKNVVLSRAGSMLLGLIAFVLLVWYAGPYIGIRETNLRLLIIGAVVGLFMIYVLINWLITRRRAAKFNQALAEQGADEGHQADIAALRDKMQEAIASLNS